MERQALMKYWGHCKQLNVAAAYNMRAQRVVSETVMMTSIRTGIRKDSAPHSHFWSGSMCHAYKCDGLACPALTRGHNMDLSVSPTLPMSKGEAEVVNS